MLTNEQRAHDLAIAILRDFKSALISEKMRESNSNEDVHFDYYLEYKKIYSIALEAINRDFPSGK